MAQQLKALVQQAFAYPIAIIDLGDELHDFFDAERERNDWKRSEHDHSLNNYASRCVTLLNKYPKETQLLTECLYWFKDNVMRWDKTDFVITTSWLTKTDAGGFSKSHSHYNSLISGVVYDKTLGSDSGELVFDSPSHRHGFFPCYPSEQNIYNGGDFSVMPSPNHLILFESSLSHRIGRHLSNQPRVSMAFNSMPVGQFGVGDSSLCIEHKRFHNDDANDVFVAPTIEENPA